MGGYVLYPVVELRGYIILTVVLLFLLTAAVLVLMGRRRRGLETFQWQAVFLGLSKREILWMAMGLSQIVFVAAMIFFFDSVGTVHLAALAILCVVKAVLGLSFTGIIGEVVYGGLTGVALLTGNLLLDYMNETGLDVYIFLIWVLLSLFVLQYSVYYFIKGLERMLWRHERAKQRQKEKK